jgi:quercetin dioxygenase-like cupin family protein
MSIEVRRFGVGHRRPEGPPGTVGVTGQVIHSDERGVVAELAFARGARMEAHSNPNLTWFVVIEGGGWAAVGDEQVRVAAGEAVRFPPTIEHAAWTDHTPMRAMVVEFGSGEAHPALLLEGRAIRLEEGDEGEAARGEGALRDDPDRTVLYDPGEGEPV